MSNQRRWLWGLTAAALLPTCLQIIYFAGLEFASPYPNSDVLLFIALVAFIVSLSHVVLLGFPGLLLLSKMRQLRGWSICLLGFLAGCLPVGLWAWPLKSSLRGASDSHWDGEKMVSSMVNGIPTLVGWLNYVEGVMLMGVLGAISGLAFWIVWNTSGSSNHGEAHEIGSVVRLPANDPKRAVTSTFKPTANKK